MPAKTHWTIRFSCGCTETKDLSSKPAHKRAGFAKWLQTTGTCTDCWRAEQGLPARAEWVEDKATWIAQQREKETEAAQEWSSTAEMPPLVASSDKQRDFAEKTRYQLLHQLYVWCVQEEHDPDEYTAYEDIARALDSARWWLDQREQATESAETLIELLQSAAADGEGTDCENTYT